MNSPEQLVGCNEGPAAGSQGDVFSDFVGVSGPESQETPCKWSTSSQNSPRIAPFFNAIPKQIRRSEFSRQIQEYCLAGGSWSTVGHLASALQEAQTVLLSARSTERKKPLLENNQQGTPREDKPTVQPNRTLGFPDFLESRQILSALNTGESTLRDRLRLLLTRVVDM